MALISILYKNNITVLSRTGNLDTDGAFELTRALNTALIRRASVAVDLCKVKLADPAILSCLQILARALMRRGQKLLVRVAGNSQPQHLLNEACLGDWMDITTAPATQTVARSQWTPGGV